MDVVLGIYIYIDFLNVMNLFYYKMQLLYNEVWVYCRISTFNKGYVECWGRGVKNLRRKWCKDPWCPPIRVLPRQSSLGAMLVQLSLANMEWLDIVRKPEDLQGLSIVSNDNHKLNVSVIFIADPL